MRHTQRCPKCSGRKLFRVNPFMLPEGDSSNVVQALAAVTRAGNGTTETHGWSNRLASGTFEVWICGGCGLTEWYARDANATLTQLARTADSGVTFVDGDAAGTPPYR